MVETKPEVLKEKLGQLQKEAIRLGATDAVVIASEDILTDETLAGFCNGEYVCPHYGLAASCPPHVGGPEQFRKWQENSRYALTVKIEIPSAVLFSDKKEDFSRRLHLVVAGTEQKAVELGFIRSRGFSGGSCKPLFCNDHETCCVVEGHEPCRHKDEARPSMSGFGVDVVRLMESSGWNAQKADPGETGEDEISWVVGLVLIAE